MNPKVLAFVDRLFSLPYKMLRLLFVLKNKSKKPITNNQIVVIKLMGLGSLTFFSSQCEKRKIDKDKIVLITFESNRHLCNQLGLRNIVSIRHRNLLVFLIDCIGALHTVYQFKSISLIDYERCSYAVGLFRFTIAILTHSKIICFENIDRNFESNNLKAYSCNLLTIEKMFALGMELMPMSEKPNHNAILAVKTNTIFVNCNSSSYLLARRYPQEKLKVALERIHLAQPQYVYIFTGSESEKVYVERIVSKLRMKGITATNMAGEWSIEDFSRELRTCSLIITCDSFPLHQAAYLGIPTLAIWGPTQPEQFGYENHNFIRNVSLKMKCAPCLLHLHSSPALACMGTITCMRDLSANSIVKEAIDLLSVNQDSRTIEIT